MPSEKLSNFKIQNLLLLLILGLFVTIACKKYQYGPVISLRSKTERLANTWKIESVMENGINITSTYIRDNYSESYQKNGEFSVTSAAGNANGNWSFQADETEIKRTDVNGLSSVDITILRLKENSFWYKTTLSGHNLEFHLIPQ